MSYRSHSDIFQYVDSLSAFEFEFAILCPFQCHMVDLHLNSPPYLLCEIGTNFCAFQNCCETVADWVLLTEASYIWLLLHSGPLIFHTTNAAVSLVALCAGMLKIPDWRRFELKIFFMFAFCCGSVFCTIKIQRWFGDVIMLYTQNPCVTLNHKRNRRVDCVAFKQWLKSVNTIL